MRLSKELLALSLSFTTACGMSPIGAGSSLASSGGFAIIESGTLLEDFNKVANHEKFAEVWGGIQNGTISAMFDKSLNHAGVPNSFNLNGVQVHDLNAMIKQNRDLFKQLDSRYKSFGAMLKDLGGFNGKLDAQTLADATKMLRDYNQQTGIFAGRASLTDAESGLSLSNACSRSAAATTGCRGVAGGGGAMIAGGILICIFSFGAACPGGVAMIGGGAAVAASGGICAGVSRGVTQTHCDTSNSKEKDLADDAKDQNEKAQKAAVDAIKAASKVKAPQPKS